MIDVRVADERAEDAVPMILLETELYVVGVEVKVGLGRGDPQDQRHFDERVARPFHVQAGVRVALVHRQARSDARYEPERRSPRPLQRLLLDRVRRAATDQYDQHDKDIG